MKSLQPFKAVAVVAEYERLDKDGEPYSQVVYGVLLIPELEGELTSAWLPDSDLDNEPF